MPEMPAPPPPPQDKTLRIPVFVLGAWNMASWLMYASSNWFGEDVKEITLYMWSQFLMLVVVQPLVTLPGLYLAWIGQRLKLALFLVGIPWLYFFGSVIAFAIGVSIYGF